MRGPRGISGAFALAALALAACSLADGGLAHDASFPLAPPDGDGMAVFRPDAPSTPIPVDAGGREAGRPLGPVAIGGEPSLIGCSDGSREAFLDLSARGWPKIAGCAGGWSVPGLMLPASRTLHCARNGGDSGDNPTGIGCGAADLCAVGWHVCAGPGEVQRLSPSHCESAVPSGVTAFFAVAGGGNLTGDCAVGVAGANDVRGCGTLGQPEGDGCYPLDRRLEFGDCLGTQGVWHCGSATDHLLEVERVFKAKPELGGVLCCRDDL